MNIRDYYKRLNTSCQQTFESTLSDLEAFGEIHHFSACLFDFSSCLQDKNESELLKVVSSQIEMSALTLTFGLYRQAFTSMRLALEMGLGVVYFSAFKLEHYEWLQGRADIKWSRIASPENGVLSKRFAEAFFPELASEVEQYNKIASQIYRQLSEFVHGNYETWEASGLVLGKKENLVKKYFEYYPKVKNVLLFALCCRFLKGISDEHIDALSFLAEEMGHHASIRVLIGGPQGE